MQNNTPKANRTHIVFLGKCNSGKSSLINCFVGHEVSIVSNKAGTTTDPVLKAIELPPLGPCVIIDTAGIDDKEELGKLRIQKTKEAVEKADIAVVLFSDDNFSEEALWIKLLTDKNIPFIPVISKSDLSKTPQKLVTKIQKEFNLEPLITSAKEKQGLVELKEALAKIRLEDNEKTSITGELVKEKELVVLVMPQNIQAPKGRLILAQVQTIRELLDKKCITICTTTETLEQTLNFLNTNPVAIITDSQDFKKVAALTPEGTKLTSFSVLFAAYKGDLEYYKAGTACLDTLKPSSKILIAECCSHAPLSEDIGREKIPTLLRQRIGIELQIDIVSGNDYPEDLTPYDLIIHCGGCMFTRKHVLARINRAKQQKVPMTNYGLALAHLQGVLV